MFNLIPYLSVLDNVILPCRFSARRRERAEQSGSLQARRRDQELHWFDETVEELLRIRFFSDPKVAAALPQLREAVAAGRQSATAAARALVQP